MPAAESEESLLELGAGGIRRDSPRNGQAKKLGLAHRRGEFGWGNVSAQIQQCPRWGRHRDPGTAGALTSTERRGAVKGDAPVLLPSRSPRNSHLDRGGFAASAGPGKPAGTASNSPQLSRTSVAEYREISTGEDGRHPAPFLAESMMTDGVNTAVNAVEAAVGGPLGDLAAGQPDPGQLSSRDHTVLVSRNPGDYGIPERFVAFPSYGEGKATSASVSPPRLGKGPSDRSAAGAGGSGR